MRIAVTLLIVGGVLLAYAAALAPYKNEQAYNERYMNLAKDQRAEFGTLRDEMLTPKFRLQDYGGTLIVSAFIVFLIERIGATRIQSPKAHSSFIVLAIVAPVVTVGAYLYALLQADSRGDFPYWADSVGIPLLAVSVVLIIFLAWAMVHLTFLRGRQPIARRLMPAISLTSNWWLSFVSVSAAAFVLFAAALGQYWYVISGMIWLYFYLSLSAVRLAVPE